MVDTGLCWKSLSLQENKYIYINIVVTYINRLAVKHAYGLGAKSSRFGHACDRFPAKSLHCFCQLFVEVTEYFERTIADLLSREYQVD